MYRPPTDRADPRPVPPRRRGLAVTLLLAAAVPSTLGLLAHPAAAAVTLVVALAVGRRSARTLPDERWLRRPEIAAVGRRRLDAETAADGPT